MVRMKALVAESSEGLLSVTLTAKEYVPAANEGVPVICPPVDNVSSVGSGAEPSSSFHV